MRDSADKVKTTVSGAFKNIRDSAFLVTGAVGGMSAVLIKGANKASELNSQYNVIKNNFKAAIGDYNINRILVRLAKKITLSRKGR